MDSHEEYQYLQLIGDIIENGTKEQGRNGNTIVKFGVNMRFSLKDGTLPLITTKKWHIDHVSKNCFGLFAVQRIMKN